MNLIRCRSCEKIQSSSSNCRRCGRSLASFDRVATPVPPSSTTIVTVDRPAKLAAPVVDVTHTIAEIERAVIMARVDLFKGNVEAAAQSLGIGRNTIYRKLRQYKRCNGAQNGTGAIAENPE